MPDAVFDPVNEGDDGADHSTPAELLELYEVLEWQAAVEAEGSE